MVKLAETEKARRRIRRFLKTGKKVARVHVHERTDGRVFEYKAKHHGLSYFFKADKLGRLRQINNTQ